MEERFEEPKVTNYHHEVSPRVAKKKQRKPLWVIMTLGGGDKS
jgi:hypothetical protein